MVASLALTSALAGCASSDTSATSLPAVDAGDPVAADVGRTPSPAVAPCTVVFPTDPRGSDGFVGYSLAARFVDDQLYVISTWSNNAWGYMAETALVALGPTTVDGPHVVVGAWPAASAVWDGRGFLVLREDPRELVSVTLDGVLGPPTPVDCEWLARGDGLTWCATTSEAGTHLHVLDRAAERFVPATLDGEPLWPALLVHDGVLASIARGGAFVVLDPDGTPRAPPIRLSGGDGTVAATERGFVVLPHLPTDATASGRVQPFRYYDRDGRPTSLSSRLVDENWHRGLPPITTVDVVLTTMVASTTTMVAAVSPDGRVGGAAVIDAPREEVVRSGPNVALIHGFSFCDFDAPPCSRVTLGDCR